MSKYINKKLSKKVLEIKYIDERLSVKDIATELGFSYPYIQRLIKRFNIPRRRLYDNISNLKFGKLTALEFSHVYKKKTYWKCECECGKYKTTSYRSLKTGWTTSCGCDQIKRIGELSRKHVANIRYHAKSRNLEFDLTDTQMWELYIKQNKKCAISGVDLIFDIKVPRNTTASLDRINSDIGYIISNVQWVHKEINAMKSYHVEQYFLEWIDKIYKHQHA
jgi:hypothetical protein